MADASSLLLIQDHWFTLTDFSVGQSVAASDSVEKGKVIDVGLWQCNNL
jgi:hypothetical protein